MGHVHDAQQAENQSQARRQQEQENAYAQAKQQGSHAVSSLPAYLAAVPALPQLPKRLADGKILASFMTGLAGSFGLAATSAHSPS